MITLSNTTLADPAAESARRELVDAVREMQRIPITGALVLSNVRLEDGIAKPIAHGLGRAPVFVMWTNLPRGAVTVGMVTRVIEGVDHRKLIKLTASGWGATITVDVLVF